jgi:hypothetical protein
LAGVEAELRRGDGPCSRRFIGAGEGRNHRQVDEWTSSDGDISAMLSDTSHVAGLKGQAFACAGIGGSFTR